MNALQQVIAERIARAKVREYRRGLQDGTEIALKLMLGREQFGAKPAPAPLPEPLREWAERALARIEAERNS